VFRNLFKPKAKPAAASTGGRLVYAVGDVHGHLDALEPLILTLAEDALASQPAERPMLIFVGDYVDRGPASAGVVERILGLMRETAFEVRTLKGNHEEALLQFLEEPSFGATWADFGGNTTLASYGVQPPAQRTDTEAWIKASEALAEALPAEHLEFYRNLELMIEVGDYAFVHAGVRPGVPLSRQSEKDLIWIRQEFLTAPGRFEKIIVHGHTPMEEPQVLPARIGIDTGVYATGVLTAVRLDDTGPRILQARARRAAAA